MEKKGNSIQVKLKVLLDAINVPTVIKEAVIPGDTQPSLFITTQPGEIWLIGYDKPQKILDISAKNKGDVIPLGHVLSTYDERGLLGIEFHPQFTKNGRFFLYFSTKDHRPKVSSHYFWPAPNPCNQRTIDVTWKNLNEYDHINVVEEWKFTTLSDIKRVRRLLAIKHPFANHVSINNLFWSTQLNKLLLLTGDGGFRDGPFNLSQNDAFFQGKVIALDVESPAWPKFIPKPVARFDELPKEIRPLLETVVKGVRNWSGMCETKIKDDTVTFFGQPGQDTVEAVYAIKDFFKIDPNGKKVPLNIGWRGWEGSFPLVQNMDCKTHKFSIKTSNLKNLAYYQEAVNVATVKHLPYCEYYHDDKRPGKVEAVCITGQQLYKGESIKTLKNHLVISDWAQNTGEAFHGQAPKTPGFLIAAPLDDAIDKPHDYKTISIVHDFKKPAYFVSLGANMQQTRLFLGVYQTTGSRMPNLGTVYELVAAD
jgi:hypothetical protein